MADAPSLDQMLQESRRKRKAEELAQQIFGRKGRSQTPQGPRDKHAPGASLASRVGVAKRPSSLSRSHTAPAPRNARVPPPKAPQTARPTPNGNIRSRSTFNQPLPSDPLSSDAKSNGHSSYDDAQNGANINISFRGAAAAAGPHIVIAQNFAPGTSAADIESVMVDVGGVVTDCHLISENPTVIAEMTFAEKSGAEAVINTFNGKKADGRTLNVFLKSGGSAALPIETPVVEPDVDEVMEVDENAQAREAENRRREERRAAPRDPYPTEPKGDRGAYPEEPSYYHRDPRRAEPAYQDGRYGYGGGGRSRYNDRGGYGRGGGGHMYSDRMGRGGQSWRP